MLKKCDDSSTSKITHQVRIDAEYNSALEYFDFDSDMDPWTISRAMSKVSCFSLTKDVEQCIRNHGQRNILIVLKQLTKAIMNNLVTSLEHFLWMERKRT